jgi:hypothetical protein
MAATKKGKAKPARKIPAKKPASGKKPAKKGAPRKAPIKKVSAAKPRKRPAAKSATPPRVARLSAVAVAAPRRPAKPGTVPPAAPERGPLPGEDPVGVVTHYYGHLSVAVIRLDTGTLHVGDMIRILGHTTDFRQRVDSLQIDHEAVGEVGRRQEFGLKVKEHVREHDVVYKVAP